MKNDQVIKYFLDCRHECSEETKAIRKVWDELLNQYMCKKDWGEKKKWQFKVYVPISKPKIKKATRLIKRIMIKTGDYFDFDNPSGDEEKERKCWLTRQALKAYLNAAGFVDKFAEALESGFTLSMMILKFWVAETEDHFSIDLSQGEIVYPTSPKLMVKVINPFNFWFTRDHTINIEDEWITLPELNRMAEKTLDSDNNPVYNLKEIKKLTSTDYGSFDSLSEEDQERLRTLNLDKHDNLYRKYVKLSHFWGPLINKNNKIIKDNCHFIVGNDKYMILDPRDNPFWHGKSPYVYDSPLKVLFRHIGKGLTEDVRGLEDAVTDFVNLQLDNLMWRMMGVREVDEMAFTEFGRSDLRELYPGKLIRKRTGYQGQAFRFHEMGVDPAQAMPMLSELKTFHDEEHGVTPYVESMPGSASERATVYMGKRESALGDFQSIALDIERGFLVKCLDRARDLMIQYLMDFDNPQLTDIFRRENLDLAAMSPDERRAMIVTDVGFVGKGVSIFFERQRLLEKIGAYVKMLNALPEQAHIAIKWKEIFKRITEAFTFENPDQMLYTDEEIAAIQAQIRQAQITQMALEMQRIKQDQDFEMQKLDKELMVKLHQIEVERDIKEKDRFAKLLTERTKETE